MVNVTAADGFWHTLYFQRRGRSIVLAQDGKEGPMYVETTTDSKHQELTVRQTQIYAGAEVSYDHSKKIDQTNPKDLENCEWQSSDYDYHYKYLSDGVPQNGSVCYINFECFSLPYWHPHGHKMVPYVGWRKQY